MKSEHRSRHALAGAMLAFVALAASFSSDVVAAQALEATTGGATRAIVDVTTPPWRAIGQVNNAAYGRCTGVLVSRSLVATAAHCVYNARTDRFLRPQAITFVLGYDRGEYVFTTRTTEIYGDERYAADRPQETLAHDWVMLVLAEPAPAFVAPADLATRAAEPGRALLVGGYASDRAYAMTRQTCRALTAPNDRTLRIDCRVPHGYSGGPIFDRASGDLLGIVSATGHSSRGPVTIGVPVDNWLDAMQ